MRPRPGDHGSIRLGQRIGFRILLAVLGVAVSAVVVTGVVQYMLSSSVMRDNVVQRNLQIARRAASEIDLYLRTSLSELLAIEQSITPIRDPWVRDLILENTVTIHRQFGSLTVVDRRAEVLASSVLENGKVRIPREIVEGALSSGERTVSPVGLSAEGLPFITVALPTRWNGTDPALLVAEVFLRDVWSTVDGISFGASGEAMLFSRDGVLIAHPDKTKILSSAMGSAIADAVLHGTRTGGAAVLTAEDGTALLVVGWPVEVLDWLVVVQQPLRDAWVPLGAMLIYSGAAVFGFVLVAVLASLVVARRLSGPLAVLLAGTERIRAGNLSHRIRIEGRDEIARLSRSFNDMVGDLEERSEGLARSEAKYRLLTENLTEIVFSLDETGRVLYVNRQVERILGHLPAAVVGADASRVVRLGEGEPDGPGLAEGEVHREVEVSDARGRRVVLEIALVRTTEVDSGVAFYGVARDITDRKDAEARLRDYQEQLRSLASQLTLTEARERKRIAADIHDRIGQSLALTRIKLGLLAGGPLLEEQAQTVAEALPLLERVIQDTRSLIFSVSSPLLYELGLGAALERLVEQFNEGYDVDFRYVELGGVPALGVDASVLLFDAVKELMVNIVKHAGARIASVTMAGENGEARLDVADDGVGIDTGSPVRPAGGFGLFSVRERLQYMRGSMRIDSSPGAGTRITLRIPTDPDAREPKGGQNDGRADSDRGRPQHTAGGPEGADPEAAPPHRRG